MTENKCGGILFMLQTKRNTCREIATQYQGEHPLKRLIGRHHIPPYLLLSQEDDHDVREIGKHDFRSVLLHPMLSNANPSKLNHRFKREIRAVKAIRYPPDSTSQRGKNNDPKPNLTKENRHNTMMSEKVVYAHT